jgi:hypothetical protein
MVSRNRIFRHSAMRRRISDDVQLLVRGGGPRRPRRSLEINLHSVVSRVRKGYKAVPVSAIPHPPV